MIKYRKQFISYLEDLRALEGWRAYEAMSAFLTCSYNAIRKTTELGVLADKCESDYMQVVHRCQKPKKSMAIMAKMLGLVTMALEERLADFIGPVFMETSASDRMGQFFTPDSVCYMMAQTTLAKAPAILERQSHITIDEPASGAGAMILACCRYLKSIGVNYQMHCGFRLTDLDHDAYMASYIQCSLAGVPARIIQGNTLTLELRDSARTPMLMMRPWLAREATVLKQTQEDTPGNIQIESDGQMVIDWFGAEVAA